MYQFNTLLGGNKVELAETIKASAHFALNGALAAPFAVALGIGGLLILAVKGALDAK